MLDSIELLVSSRFSPLGTAVIIAKGKSLDASSKKSKTKKIQKKNKPCHRPRASNPFLQYYFPSSLLPSLFLSIYLSSKIKSRYLLISFLLLLLSLVIPVVLIAAGEYRYMYM